MQATTLSNSTTPALSLKARFRPLEKSRTSQFTQTSVASVPVKDAFVSSYSNAKNEFLDSSALQSAELSFGKLSANEFTKLRDEFGGRSQVLYRSDRDYSASDFLPPAMQALLGQDLEIPEPQVLPHTANWFARPFDEDKPVDLTANCHGTTWETVQALQGDNDLDIFFGDAISMDSNLENEKLFQKLASHTPEQVEASGLPTDNLKPGDVLALHNPNGYAITNLLHTAVYVGGGLFFEKPDTEGRDNDAPYRLATPEMVLRPVQAFLEGTPRVEVYRPSEQLPAPEIGFAANSFEEQQDWEQTQGRLIGMPILVQSDIGLGGGITGQYLTTLVDQSVSLDSNGRGVLARQGSRP